VTSIIGQKPGEQKHKNFFLAIFLSPMVLEKVLFDGSRKRGHHVPMVGEKKMKEHPAALHFPFHDHGYMVPSFPIFLPFPPALCGAGPEMEQTNRPRERVQQNARLTVRRRRPLVRVEPCQGLGQREPGGVKVRDRTIGAQQCNSVLPGVRHSGKLR